MLPLLPVCLAACLLVLCLLPPVAMPAQNAAVTGRETPVSIRDDAGQTVSLAAPARRIIPLYAALSDTLLALGLDKQIIARTVSDDILPASLPAVGTHMRPNPELMTALKPDLVVQLEGRSEAGLAAQSLARLGIPVARFRISSFEELFSCIERLGVLCGREQEAASLVAGMRERLKAAKEQAPQNAPTPSVFFEVRYPNLLGAGAGSMLSDIIIVAGGENSLKKHPDRMVRLSEEMLVSLDPDIYLVQQGPMNKNPSPPEQRAHFSSLGAVRNGFVFFVPEARFSRPGPQSVTAVEELAGILRQWREKRQICAD